MMGLIIAAARHGCCCVYTNEHAPSHNLEREEGGWSRVASTYILEITTRRHFCAGTVRRCVTADPDAAVARLERLVVEWAVGVVRERFERCAGCACCS